MVNSKKKILGYIVELSSSPAGGTAQALHHSTFLEQTAVALGTAQFFIHPIPTSGTAGALNALYVFKSDCREERSDPTPMEEAINPFRWLIPVLSIFLSQRLVSLQATCSQLSVHKEMFTARKSSTADMAFLEVTALCQDVCMLLTCLGAKSCGSW